MHIFKEKISINVPPPYCNGDLHIGHVYQYAILYPFYNFLDTQTKTLLYKQSQPLIRSLQTTSYDVHFSLGIDVNGLPITRLAKEHLKTYNSETLKAKCDQLVDLNVERFKSIYETLGLFKLRSSSVYTTNDQIFKDLTKKFLDTLDHLGYLRLKKMPQRFCDKCKTILANSQTELVNQKGQSYLIKMHDLSGKEYLIMTTLPEYLLGIKFVIYNPKDDRYDLKGKKLYYRLNNKTYQVPVYESDRVYPKVGTGLVMIACWGSLIDIEVCRELELFNESSLFNPQGLLLESIQDEYSIKSLDEFWTIPGIKDLITFTGTLETKTLRHTERSDCYQRIKFISKEELVVSPSKECLRNLLKYIETLDIRPDSAFNQLKENIKNLKDWCVSRNKDYYSLSYTYKGKTYQIDTWVVSSVSSLLYDVAKVVRFQGTDIIRTWLVYSLFAHYIFEKIPLKHVSMHRMVVDSNNQKISKSKNTSPDLKLTLKNLPALRLYFCQKPVDQDFKFTQKELVDTEKFLHKVHHLALKVDSLKSVKTPHVVSWLSSLSPQFLKSPLGSFYQGLGLFFKEDLLRFKFSRMVNSLKSTVYALSNLLTKAQEPNYESLVQTFLKVDFTLEECHWLIQKFFKLILETLQFFN